MLNEAGLDERPVTAASAKPFSLYIITNAATHLEGKLLPVLSSSSHYNTGAKFRLSALTLRELLSYRLYFDLPTVWESKFRSCFLSPTDDAGELCVPADVVAPPVANDMNLESKSVPSSLLELVESFYVL